MVGLFDRRSFIKGVAAGAAFLIAPLAQLLRPLAALAAIQPTGFRFIHDGSVAIVLDYAKKADRYDVIVRQGGQTVQSFANAHPMRLHRLRTDHVTVEYFDPVAG